MIDSCFNARPGIRAAFGLTLDTVGIVCTWLLPSLWACRVCQCYCLSKVVSKDVVTSGPGVMVSVEASSKYKPSWAAWAALSSEAEAQGVAVEQDGFE